MDRYPRYIEPGGLNKKRYEDVIKPIQNEDVFPFVVPFSKTANIAARIIKKHYNIHQQKEVLNDYEYRIITAYSKHKSLASSLVKKTLYLTMSPGALNRFSFNTSPVKQLKPSALVITLVKQSNIS